MKDRAVGFLAATVCAALALSGCSSDVDGQATPSPPSSAPTATTANPDDPFAGLNQCTVLNQALTGLGYPSATPDLADPKKSCGTNDMTGNGGSVGLAFNPGRKIDDSLQNPQQAASGLVNTRRAILEPEPLHVQGGCDVFMEVKQTSRAVVTFASTILTTDQACSTAKNIATKVEPLLPKDN